MVVELSGKLANRLVLDCPQLRPNCLLEDVKGKKLKYWKFIAFQDGTLRVPFIIIIIILFASFLWVECPFNLWLKTLASYLVRKYAEGKGPVADSVCGLTTWEKDLLLPLLLLINDSDRLLLWGVQHWSGLSGRYESTSKSWIHLYFPAYAPYAWEKVVSTLKALPFDFGNSKNGPEVYALDVIIQLWKVEFSFGFSVW